MFEMLWIKLSGECEALKLSKRNHSRVTLVNLRHRAVNWATIIKVADHRCRRCSLWMSLGGNKV